MTKKLLVFLLLLSVALVACVSKSSTELEFTIINHANSTILVNLAIDGQSAFDVDVERYYYYTLPNSSIVMSRYTVVKVLEVPARNFTLTTAESASGVVSTTQLDPSKGRLVLIDYYPGYFVVSQHESYIKGPYDYTGSREEIIQ